MPTPGRGQFVRERFNRLVEEIWPEFGPDDKVSSRFSLFRRQTTTTTTTLGVPKTPWTEVVLDQPCMYLGAWSESAERFGLTPAGFKRQTMIVLWTTYEDVHEGDDLYLFADGRHYFVQEAQVEGGLRRLLCDSSQAQHVSP